MESSLGRAITCFHGFPPAGRPARFLRAGGISDQPDMMFWTRSANVAQRYAGSGGGVLALELDSAGLPSIAAENWFKLSRSELPSGTFVIRPDAELFDFPVDTLVLRGCPGRPFRELDASTLSSLDDGLPTSHDMPPPWSPHWQLWVSDLMQGDWRNSLSDAWERHGPWPSHRNQQILASFRPDLRGAAQDYLGALSGRP